MIDGKGRFLKGHVSWKKGKTGFKGYWTGKKRDIITIKRMKEKLKGRHVSLQTEFKKGRISNRKGIILSDEIKKKISDTCKRKGIRVPVKYCSHKKENHWNWKNGKSEIYNIVRGLEQYKIWRQTIFIRDNFKCQICNSNSKLEAHHKKPLRKIIDEIREYLPLLDIDEACKIYVPLWDISNGITYCHSCHVKVEPRNVKLKEIKNELDKK